MKIYLSIALYLISSITYAQTISVGPVADTDCDFNTIAEAINSGGDHMIIAVSNQLVTANGVIINNKSISGFYGGYDNCADAIAGNLSADGTATVISNPDDVALSLSESFDASATIDVGGFDLTDSDTGLKIGSGASTTEFNVSVNNINSYNNNNGLFMFNDSTIVSFNHGSIHDNLSGSGILCLSGKLTIGEVTSIYANTAAKGGGINAIGCDITLFAGDSKAVDETRFGIFNNTATEIGGGVYLTDTIFTANGNFHQPASISFNSAPTDATNKGYGGGFYVNSGSVVTLNHTRVDGNTAAKDGGALYIKHNSSNFAFPQFIMQRLDLECSHGNSPICSSMSHNSTLVDNGRGGAVYMYQDTQVEIYQTILTGNKSEFASVFHVEGELDHPAILKLEGDLIVANTWNINFGTGKSSIMLADSHTDIEISHTTISDNIVFEIFRIVSNSRFRANNSIIVHLNPMIRSFSVTDTIFSCTVYQANLGTNNAPLFTDTTFYDNPEFINAIDYGLQDTSPALDSDCTDLNPATHSDIIGNNRFIDGAADLGAYEMNIETEMPIFANGFE